MTLICFFPNQLLLISIHAEHSSLQMNAGLLYIPFFKIMTLINYVLFPSKSTLTWYSLFKNHGPSN
jgi:hypothetical protein